MNTEQEKKIAESIRSAYVPEKENKLDQLRKLDARVKLPAEIFAYIFGIVGALVLGGGNVPRDGSSRGYAAPRRGHRLRGHRHGGGQLLHLRRDSEIAQEEVCGADSRADRRTARQVTGRRRRLRNGAAVFSALSGVRRTGSEIFRRKQLTHCQNRRII